METFEVEFTVVSLFKKTITVKDSSAAVKLVTKGLTLEAKDLVETQHLETRIFDSNGNELPLK